MISSIVGVRETRRHGQHFAAATAELRANRAGLARRERGVFGFHQKDHDLVNRIT
jgi:hypothetical protein